jgi:hypothetical protein
MIQPNYQEMTEQQLRQYVKQNPQDEDAFQYYLSIIRSRPGRVIVSGDDEFEKELQKRINQG